LADALIQEKIPFNSFGIFVVKYFFFTTKVSKVYSKDTKDL